jgi:hypothetical protein
MHKTMARKTLPALVASIALIAACGSANAGLLRSIAHGVAIGAGVAAVTGAAHAASERCHNVMDPEKGHKVLQCSKTPASQNAPATGLGKSGN